MVNPTSRYANIPTETAEDADGAQVAYLRRRFLPPVAAAATMVEHLVREGDRLDNLTARYLDDPELFWQVCDANHTLHPADLLAEVGRRIRIPLP